MGRCKKVSWKNPGDSKVWGSEWMIHVVRKARLFQGRMLSIKVISVWNVAKGRKNGPQLEDDSFIQFLSVCFYSRAQAALALRHLTSFRFPMAPLELRGAVYCTSDVPTEKRSLKLSVRKRRKRRKRRTWSPRLPYFSGGSSVIFMFSLQLRISR